MSFFSRRSSQLLLSKYQPPLYSLLDFDLSLLNIIRHSRRTDLTPEQKSLGEPLRKRELVQQVLSIYLLFGTVYLAALFSDSHLFLTAPLLPCLLYSFIYVHNTVHIQVAHVTKQKFQPWTRVLIMNLTMLASYLFITLYQRYL